MARAEHDHHRLALFLERHGLADALAIKHTHFGGGEAGRADPGLLPRDQSLYTLARKRLAAR